MKDSRTGKDCKAFLTICCVTMSMLLFSCKGSTVNENPASNNAPNDRNKDSLKMALKHCIPYEDTMFQDECSIRYVTLDTTYDVFVRIRDKEISLGYGFNCNVPRGLVPSLKDYYNNVICLVRGTGQYYREFIICYLDNEKVKINKYETGLAIDLKNNIVLYSESDSYSVFIENIKSGIKRKIEVPTDYNLPENRIIDAIIKNRIITLSFYDGKSYSFPE